MSGDENKFGLKKRNITNNGGKETSKKHTEIDYTNSTKAKNVQLKSGTYWLTRILLLRSVSFVFGMSGNVTLW